MKKIHLFVLRSLLGPFSITLTVLVFIFLVQFLMNYMDELAGKGVGLAFFAKLSFYFSFKMIPKSLPLAVLLSSLMAYGNLGQFNELTAIKSSGISLPRIMTSSFWFIFFVSIMSFCLNNYVVPKTNLKAYSLFYDIRHKEATFDLTEKAFYSGLPGYSIRVDKKYEDGKSLKNVIVYNHSNNKGNKELIIADSGKMQMINQERYLEFTLYKGARNSDVIRNDDYGQKSNDRNQPYAVSLFDSSQMVFDMSSFNMGDTPEELFKQDRRMLSVGQLYSFVDSVDKKQEGMLLEGKKMVDNQHRYYNKQVTIENEDGLSESIALKNYDSLLLQMTFNQKNKAMGTAINNTTNYENSLEAISNRYKSVQKNKNKYKIALLQKITGAVACIAMFLIGAPIGAIIKKGGLGMPILVGIAFFIYYYMFTEYVRIASKEGNMIPEIGMWLPNISLLLISFWFLNKARKDARLFELDRYSMIIEKIIKKSKR